MFTFIEGYMNGMYIEIKENINFINNKQVARKKDFSRFILKKSE